MWLPQLGDLQTLQVTASDLGETWIFGDGEPTASVEGSASDLYLCLVARPSPVQLPEDWVQAVEGLAPPRKR